MPQSRPFRNFLLLFLTFSFGAFGSVPSILPHGGFLQLDRKQFEDNFEADNNVLEKKGSWKKTWPGFFCDGDLRIHYDATILEKNIDLEPKSERVMDVTLSLQDGKIDITTNYDGSFSLCLPLEKSFGASVDSLTIKGEVTLQQGSMQPNAKVRILSTDFGTIHLGSVHSSRLDAFLRRVVNAAFREVWRSKVGKSIDTWITQQLASALPEPSVAFN